MEKNIADSIPSFIYYVRIKDSATSFGESVITKFTPNNPYDAFMFYKGCLFPIEIKTTKQTSVSIQTTKKQKGKMIKMNQVKGLTKAQAFRRVYAGFILDFRKTDKTYYLGIDDFNQFMRENNKKSINEADVNKYNGIPIKKVMKKIHYRYKIKTLLKKIIERGLQ